MAHSVYQSDKECVTERGTRIVKKLSSSCHLKPWLLHKEDPRQFKKGMIKSQNNQSNILTTRNKVDTINVISSKAGMTNRGA